VVHGTVVRVTGWKREIAHSSKKEEKKVVGVLRRSNIVEAKRKAWYINPLAEVSPACGGHRSRIGITSTDRYSKRET